jgi:hypothetical protein
MPRDTSEGDSPSLQMQKEQIGHETALGQNLDRKEVRGCPLHGNITGRCQTESSPSCGTGLRL